MPLAAELFRFRVVRPIDARDPLAGELIDLSSVASKPDTTHIDSLIDPATWQHWLRGVAAKLALLGDFVAPEDLAALLPGDWREEVKTVEWETIRTSLGESVVAALVRKAGAASVEALERLLRLHVLVSELAADRSRHGSGRTITTAADVRAALRKRVVVPKRSIPRAKGTQQLVRKPGITDLYLVKDEWNRYEPGELARVVNILPGETLDNRLRHFEETDRTTTSATETTTTQQTEQAQTTSSTLSQTSTNDASLNIGAQGQVETSGQYGPTHVSTSVGAQLQASMSSSESHAQTIGMQTVQRAVKTVSETVLKSQTTRTRVSDKSFEEHKLENSGDAPVVGLYRWLLEIHRVQLERYPNRFVIDFEIPEPGAWLRWAMAATPPNLDNPDPGPFHLLDTDQDLRPTDIDDGLLAKLAAHWRIVGLTPPPPQTIVVSEKLVVDPGTGDSPRFVVAADASMTVPTGYVADSWNAEAFSTRAWHWGSYGTEFTLIVGGGPNGKGSTGDMEQGPFVDNTLTGHVGSINTGTIPVSAYGIAVQGFVCNVNVTCTLMPEAYRQWQETAFDQIASAYQALLSAYQQDRGAAAQVGNLGVAAGPPELNQERAVNELRRLVIEELLGTSFTGESAVDTDANSTPPNRPSVDLAKARSVAPLVEFMEQAFEWENLVYICYPYYWGRESTWVTNALAASADPEFDRFLNSGFARVVVPARPGMEDMVNYFLYSGEVWGGGDPPAPDDPDYISVAQEIQALETGATDGTFVDSSWEIALPTTLIWAGTDPGTLPVNPNPTIGPPTP